MKEGGSRVRNKGTANVGDRRRNLSPDVLPIARVSRELFSEDDYGVIPDFQRIKSSGRVVPLITQSLLPVG